MKTAHNGGGWGPAKSEGKTIDEGGKIPSRKLEKKGEAKNFTVVHKKKNSLNPKRLACSERWVKRRSLKVAGGGGSASPPLKAIGNLMKAKKKRKREGERISREGNSLKKWKKRAPNLHKGGGQHFFSRPPFRIHNDGSEGLKKP